MTNPGFEPPYAVVGVKNASSGQIAYNWKHDLNGTETVVFSQDTNNPHGGTASQKITVQTIPTAPMELKQAVGLILGATYKLSAWFRGDPGTKVSLTMCEFDTPTPHTYASSAVQLTSDWRQASTTGTITAGDPGMTAIAIHVASPGTVWVDDITLTDSSGQPATGGVPWPTAGLGRCESGRVRKQPGPGWSRPRANGTGAHSTPMLRPRERTE